MDTSGKEKEHIFDLFRRWGYLQANLDPFGIITPVELPELSVDNETAATARSFYCGSIGVEFAHITDAERRQWIAQKMEETPQTPRRTFILERLVRADILEQILHLRYPGTKRFSLEGIDALIPLLDEILHGAARHGATEAVMGMSHRGRLNVMVQIIGKSPEDIFAEFEDVDPRSVLGGGDVKYHVGATGDYRTFDGKTIHIRLVSNPSHLEAVDPVEMGRVRAKQTRIGKDGTREILPILIHGDAAFAGQGITSETMNLSQIDGFSVGGSLHIIANNLLGFTAKPEELHSSRFASDVAKRFPIPIFHVNADDSEAVVRVGMMALDYRYTFSSSVVIDLIGYRRHGHSEVDDPTITQPILYKKIKDHPPLWKTYAEDIGEDAGAMAEAARDEYGKAKDEAALMEQKPQLSTLPEYWSKFNGGRYHHAYDEIDTGVTVGELQTITRVLTTVPADFHIHPKVQRLVDQRARMGVGELPVDFGMAELLAFGSLLRQDVPVRLSGQDSRRGTFSQRHAVFIDVENESLYIPLCHAVENQPLFEVYNSTLSEAAVMGYEFGFSRDYPEALVLWEAQFGDFANGGQVIIDQFISSSEDKWNLLSGLVLLLPHGYEGQGPEHSSARIERYLQLAAEDNMQVCQPSNAAQYFHLLRRQALRSWRKPLVIFTPKSMLRSPEAASPIADFTSGRFQNVLYDTQMVDPERILLCSGKIGRELLQECTRRGETRTAIVFLEQLYPFPKEELASVLERYGSAREIVWVQEEPANMGALTFVLPRLRRLAGNRPVRSIKRSSSAATATGSAKAHALEQKTLLDLTFFSGKSTL